MKDILLLHCCCAPCCCAIVESLLEHDIPVHLYFFNPNIHPAEEYERRKTELIRYAAVRGVFCIDADYDPREWFLHVQGLENEPERGRRCEACISMRLNKTALYASLHGYAVFSTSLSMSSQKNMDQVSSSGLKASQAFPGASFLNQCWRRGGLVQKQAAIIKAHQMYRQTYCGCVFSRRTVQTPVI
jgi:epoxyqueuosine reductase